MTQSHSDKVCHLTALVDARLLHTCFKKANLEGMINYLGDLDANFPNFSKRFSETLILADSLFPPGVKRLKCNILLPCHFWANSEA